MKAILVLEEMPNSCPQCPCIDVEENSYGDVIRAECGNKYKGYVGDYLGWDSGRPSWCPLRPLPSYKAVDLNDTRDVVMFCHGWNTCFNEITGETE